MNGENFSRSEEGGVIIRTNENLFGGLFDSTTGGGQGIDEFIAMKSAMKSAIADEGGEWAMFVQKGMMSMFVIMEREVQWKWKLFHKKYKYK